MIKPSQTSLRNKQANVWTTIAVTLGIVAGFIFIQGLLMVLAQSNVPALNTSQASLLDRYMGRKAGRMQTVGDLLSSKSVQPAATPSAGANDLGSSAGIPASLQPIPASTLTVTFPNQAGSVSRWLNNAPRIPYSVFWDGPSVRAKTGSVKVNLVAYSTACTAQSCPPGNTRYAIAAQTPNTGSYTIAPVQFVSSDLRPVPDKVPAGQYVVEVMAGAESDVSDAAFPIVDNPTPDISTAMCQQFQLKPGQRAWISGYGNLNIDRGSDSGDKVQISSQQGGYQGNTNFRVRYTIGVGQAISIHYAALKFISRNADTATFEVRPGGTTQVSGGKIAQEFVPDFSVPCAQ